MYKQSFTMQYLKFSQICLCLFAFVSFVAANRVKDLLYMPIDRAAVCFRRHNGTHQFGCSSSRSGNVGVIHMVENELDIEWLEKNSTAGPYIVVLSFNMFTMQNLKRFKNSNNVNGVLLTRNLTEPRPSNYSPEDTCPNRYSGYKSCDEPWNPYGSSILMEDWPFPMFFVQDQEILSKIKSYYLKHNAHNREKQTERSLCALEMKSFMFAAVDSETCIKRGMSSINFNVNVFCDPLDNRNIHWPVGPMTDNVKSVILVIARLDANALFENLVPGAGSTATGLTTLLATATYLHSLKPSVDNINVVFSLLNGEAMDYIGSGRFVYDLKHGSFVAVGGKTITFDQISSVIELGQLGEGQLYFHANNFENNSMLLNLKNNLNAEWLKNSVPPASIQSFLRANSSLPAVVLANHNKQFVNKYYHSLLDDAEGLNYTSKTSPNSLEKSLAKVAKSLGDELYKVITNGKTPSGNLTFVEKLMSELLPCYVESANCTLFHAASRPGDLLPNQVLPTYVSVFKPKSELTLLTSQLLALLTGELLQDLDVNACVEKHLLWIYGYNFDGVCVNFTTNYSAAYSPAFFLEDYDMKSGIYSTWTESRWRNVELRMFLKPSFATERLSFILGSSVTGISFILVWFITSRSDILFNTGSVDL